MNLAVNAYAIGPSLHDWEREEFEEQENEHDREDERLNADFRVWEMFTYIDRNKENDKVEIEEKMSNMIALIFDDKKEQQRFNFLLFSAYCSRDHYSDLREMIGLYLKRVYQREWIPE